ncbi:protein-disulfide reductase DsbD [Moraxella sp. FZFQ2102]|uniref:protein-disulfide reductase DsbD n=1 Tax=Moraxella sp. FZFQ2102 TaxID=2953752 RepID=UPI00209C153E|nr:protein-disulfide reductase DsbD [Moraxella sp. FZFQ2102]USZ14410.1 protein-disulfide reductase DsbD [Moraxella sp. FZFQ2102]
MTMRRTVFHHTAISLIAATLAISTPSVASLGSAGAFGALSGLFGAQKEILPVHEAFTVMPTVDGDRLTVQIKVTDGYYTYQDKLKLKLLDGVVADAWQFDKTPSWVDDPQFGRVAVFDTDVTATTVLKSAAALDQTEISIGWQGCAKAGLCYPPEWTKTSISLAADPSVVLPSATDEGQGGDQNGNTDNNQNSSSADNQTSQALDTQAAIDTAQTASAAPLAITDGFTLDHSYTPADTGASSGLVLIGLLFLAGLLLAFTPCIYPMIPIVANIVAKQNNITQGNAKHSTKRGFMLASAYGVGVATAYGVLGLIIAWFGQALGITAWFQKTWVLAIVAGLFVLYAMMMFGWVQIRLPSALVNLLQQNATRADDKLGSITGSYLAGMLSALVVSPCVSAPMAGALTAVAGSGSAVFGFLAMFALGLGLSVPLMVVGAMQGKYMPKAGAWMDRVKQFGGLMLLGVALLMIERILLTSLMLVLWAVWFLVLCLWFWRLSKMGFRVLSVLSAIWAGCLMAGASMGATDAWRPLSLGQNTATGYTQTYPDMHITTLYELDQILATRQKVLVDLTADWCIECRIMERELFTHRPALLSDYQVVKLDITETTDESRAVLARYQLFGPPALLIYHQGKLEQVLLGQVERTDFEAALAK